VIFKTTRLRGTEAVFCRLGTGSTVVEKAPSATETTVTKADKDVYVTREEAEADVAVVCSLGARGESALAQAIGRLWLAFERGAEPPRPFALTKRTGLNPA
jgi:hypothetical protein